MRPAPHPLLEVRENNLVELIDAACGRQQVQSDHRFDRRLAELAAELVEPSRGTVVDERCDRTVEERKVALTHDSGPECSSDFAAALIAAVQRTRRQAGPPRDRGHPEPVDTDGVDLLQRRVEDLHVVLLRRQRPAATHANLGDRHMRRSRRARRTRRAPASSSSAAGMSLPFCRPVIDKMIGSTTYSPGRIGGWDRGHARRVGVVQGLGPSRGVRRRIHGADRGSTAKSAARPAVVAPEPTREVPRR